MNPNGRKKLNIVLAVLLAIAAAVLAVLVCARSNAGAVSPDNYIRTESRAAKKQPSPTSNATIELFRNNPSEQFAFSVENMLPGDSTEKTYTVNVSHKGGVTLYFSAALQESTDAILAQGLSVSITRSGETLYDGTFATLPGPMAYTLPAAEKNVLDAVPYIIKVYLPTSAGNEYQNKLLTAEFKWWVSDTDTPGTPDSDNKPGSLSPWVTTPGGKPDIPKTIAGIAQTGDAFPLVLLGILCAAALGGLILLLLLRRKEDPHAHR